MPAESGYTPAVVIINRHEPEGEVSGRLLEIADEKGYGPRVVEAQRGDHDAALSFRVPEDVAETFNAERSDLWSDKIENDGEKAGDLPSAAVDEDAYAAGHAQAAQEARVTNTARAEESKNATPARTARTGKVKE